MTTEIRFGGYQPERSVHTRAARALEQQLVGEPDVAFSLEPNVTARGKAAADILDMVATGELTMAYFASSYLAARVPALGLFDLPLETESRDAVWARLDGPLGSRIAAEVAARTPYVVLGYWDNGFHHLTNGVRPIQTPADCRGLKLRTMDSAVHQRIFGALGFDPRFIDVKELPAAVADRTIDAQTNSLTNVVNFSLHKTHRHVSLTAHFHGLALLIANRAAVDAWPEDVRKTVTAAVGEATAAQRRFAADEDRECIALLEADGVAIVPSDAIDRAAFRQTLAPTIAELTTAIDRDLVDAWRARPTG